MRLRGWMAVILVGGLSIGALSLTAHAQVPFENLPKVFDASMARDQQISLALSANAFQWY